MFVKVGIVVEWLLGTVESRKSSAIEETVIQIGLDMRIRHNSSPGRRFGAFDCSLSFRECFPKIGEQK